MDRFVSGRMKRILELDGLRAIAILLVLGCHYEGFAGRLGGLPEFGYIGVDIFFVLSGYLITTILLGLRSKPSPYKTFYSRRIIRIFPPYIGASLLIVLLAIAARHHFYARPRYFLRQIFFLQAYITGTTAVLKDLLLHPRWYITHLSSLMLRAHHLPVARQGLHPYIAAQPAIYWSLSIEEYFYLLWAPIVLRLSRKSILAIGVIVCCIEILLRWMVPIEAVYYTIFTRFDALLYGAFLALLLEHWRCSSVPAWATRALTSLFTACVLLISLCLWAIRPILRLEIRDSPLILVVAMPAFCIGVACLIGLLVLRANSTWWPARLLRIRPFQYIGTISYTMYLIHILMATIVLQFMTALHHPRAHPILQSIVATFMSIGLAHLSWHYMEKPLLRWKDRRFAAAPHPPEPVLS